MTGFQRVRPVAEQHAVGGGEHERVAGGLLPGEMLRPLEQLAVLHAGELGEGAVRRLVAPDALRRREHRIAAVTRSEEHTSELQSHVNLVCRLLLEKKKKKK